MRMIYGRLNHYKENSPIGEPLGEDRGVVALMRSEFMEINSD